MKSIYKILIYFIAVLALTSSLFLGAAKAESEECPNGMVSYWKFEDLGSTATDSFTNGYDGSIYGANRVSGKVGNALEFTGASSSYVDIGHQLDPYINDDEFTVVGWINIENDATADQNVVGNWLNPGGFWTWISGPQPKNDLMTIVLNDGGHGITETWGDYLPKNTWHHFAVVYDKSGSGYTRIYIDGVERSADPVTGTRRLPTGAFRIGGNIEGDPNNGFQGKIDEVAVFDTALDATEVQALYDDTNPGVSGYCEATAPAECPNGMVSYWTFDNADLSGDDPLDVYGPNDAINFGAQTGIAGMVGEAIEFGLYEYDFLDISNDPSLETTGDISWATWAKWNFIHKGPGEGHDIMFEKGISDCVDLGYRFGTSAADFPGCNYPGKKPLYFVYDDCEHVCDSSGWEPTAGQWYHIAIVARISDQEVDFYVDGTKTSTEPCIDCVLHPNTEGIKVGKSNEPGNYYHFPGLLDEMALFNRALGPIEVQQMYLNGLDGKGYCDTVVDNDEDGFSPPDDCDDNDDTVYPNAPELCDGKDNDCDGDTDEDAGPTFYFDFDEDGYGDPTISMQACTAPQGYVADNSDCNDNDSDIFPGNPEACDGKDNDCNGQIDEGVKITFYRDSDGDTYGDPGFTTEACTAPNGYVSDNTDCDDACASCFPGATEIPNNGIDEACDGTAEVTVDSDSFVRKGFGNLNEGANTRLVVQKLGLKRTVLSFDISGITTPLTTAALVLTVAEKAKHWGPIGHLVDVNRLNEPFTEGNGSVWGQNISNKNRGTGEGVTWKCATDTNIRNRRKDCDTNWHGGSKAMTAVATDSALLTNNLIQGDTVLWDVQDEIDNAASEGATEIHWVIKKKFERQSGKVVFYSKEGATAENNIDLAPRLILE